MSDKKNKSRSKAASKKKLRDKIRKKAKAKARQKARTLANAAEKKRQSGALATGRRPQEAPAKSRTELRRQDNDMPTLPKSRTEMRRRAQSMRKADTMPGESPASSSNQPAETSGTSTNQTTPQSQSSTQQQAEVRGAIGELLQQVGRLNLKGWRNDGKTTALSAAAIDRLSPADQQKLLSDLLTIAKKYKKTKFDFDTDLAKVDKDLESWIANMDKVIKEKGFDKLLGSDSTADTAASDAPAPPSSKKAFLDSARSTLESWSNKMNPAVKPDVKTEAKSVADEAVSSAENGGDSKEKDHTERENIRSQLQKEAEIRMAIGQLLESDRLKLKAWVKDGKRVKLTQDAIDNLSPAEQESLLKDLLNVAQRYKKTKFDFDTDIAKVDDHLESWIANMNELIKEKGFDKLLGADTIPDEDTVTTAEQPLSKKDFLDSVRDTLEKWSDKMNPEANAEVDPEADSANTELAADTGAGSSSAPKSNWDTVREAIAAGKFKTASLLERKKELVNNLDQDIQEAKGEMNKYINALLALNSSTEDTITIDGNDEQWSREELGAAINQNIRQADVLIDRKKEVLKDVNDLELSSQ